MAAGLSPEPNWMQDRNECPLWVGSRPSGGGAGNQVFRVRLQPKADPCNAKRNPPMRVLEVGLLKVITLSAPVAW